MVTFDFFNPFAIYITFNLLTIVSVGLVLAKKDFIERHRKAILKAAAVLLAYTQSQRYILPLWTGTFSFEESLPFFTCRITTPILLYYTLTEERRCEPLLFYLGGTGIMGVFIPAGPIDNIPELTEYYFIDHYLLGLTPFYLVAVKGFSPSYRQAVVVTLVFALAMLAFLPLNRVLDTDYFHWRDMQLARKIIPGITPLWFTFLLTLALFSFFNLYYLMAKKYHASFAEEPAPSQNDSF